MCQAIPYTMVCPPARQTIPCSIPCHIGHTKYHMRCPPGLTTEYHAMPTRPSIYHAMHCQAMPYTMLYIARPYPIPSYACQAIPYALPCPPGHTIYHAMPARLYHIPCHASSAHTKHYAMSARPYLFPCHARQAIPYTMSCPSDHTTCHAMPTRPYHIPCHASQDIPYTMPCLARPLHIPCHAHQAIPYTLPRPPCHTIYHAMHGQRLLR